MSEAKIYCLCIHNKLLNKVKELNYIPVGLGSDVFSNEWLLDKKNINISKKNPYYGEYSFHYWLWKNELDNIPDNTWIGFCAYRRFWQRENKKLKEREGGERQRDVSICFLDHSVSTNKLVQLIFRIG